MKTRTRSIYCLDPHLFKPEPPIELRQVKRLFQGREQELERGLESLKVGLDIGGKRRRKLDKRPWVIHGESRSGKSHLARRIFAELPDNDERFQFRITAGGRQDALTVMRDLFEVFVGRFFNRVYGIQESEDVLHNAEIEMIRQLIEKIMLFEPGALSVTLSVEQGDREVAEAGLDLGGAPHLAKFVAKFQSEKMQKSGVQVTLRPPTPADLAELCGIMAEALLRRKLVRHVLILLDDVDLLEGYVSPQQNGRAQRSILADAIRILHDTPGIDVVLTARSWYAHSHKDFHTLVDLALARGMSPEELLRVHDNRLQVYDSKGTVGPILTVDALKQLAEDVDGLPGVFLQHLQTGLYEFQNEKERLPRDYDWLLGFVRQHLGLMREKCAPGFDAMVLAVKEGKLTVDVTERNPFFATMLENEYAFQSYYSETSYFLSGVVRKALTSN